MKWVKLSLQRHCHYVLEFETRLCCMFHVSSSSPDNLIKCLINFYLIFSISSLSLSLSIFSAFCHMHGWSEYCELQLTTIIGIFLGTFSHFLDAFNFKQFIWNFQSVNTSLFLVAKCYHEKLENSPTKLLKFLFIP